MSCRHQSPLAGLPMDIVDGAFRLAKVIDHPRSEEKAGVCTATSPFVCAQKPKVSVRVFDKTGTHENPSSQREADMILSDTAQGKFYVIFCTA